MATRPIPARRRHPSGQSVAVYRGSDRWGANRWAWEFLCRNVQFARMCDALQVTADDLDEQKDAIARRFHLKRFKHYLEPYAYDEMPRFQTIGVLRCQEGEDSIRRTITIPDSVVMVRFNVDLALSSSNAIPVQLKLAEKFLREHAAMLSRTRDVALPRTNARGATPQQRLEWLRMLDARIYGRSVRNGTVEEIAGVPPWSQAEAYRNIFPRQAEGKTNEDLSDAFVNAIRPAEKLAERGYLELLLAKLKGIRRQRPGVED